MNEKVLVVGLGATGLSLARHFVRLGKEVTVVDTREAPPKQAALASAAPEARFIRVASYAEVGEHAEQAQLTAVSSGVPPALLALQDSASVAGDLEIFLRSWRVRWAGSNGDRPCLILVTGTNGKSTCATLAAGLLCAAGESAETVGNIGEPLLDAFGRWEGSSWPNHVVAEVSSFQLAIAGRPAADIACLLNISADHLDWHGSERKYVAAKMKVFDGAGRAVFNRADQRCVRGASAARTSSGFGGAPDKCPPGEWTVVDERSVAGKGAAAGGAAGACGRLVRAGREHALGPATDRLIAAGILPETACAALAVADAAGRLPVGPGQLAWLSQAHGLPHRLAKVCVSAGVDYFDDSKATNVAASLAALGALGVGGTVLIAGGDGKGQNFEAFVRKVSALSGAVLIGAAAPQLGELFTSAGVRVEAADDIAAAVVAAARIAAQTNAVRVLLAPACSSLDMFESYAARGNAFRDAACRLAFSEQVPNAKCHAV